MLWRETSAQHFDQGEGGNYPLKWAIKKKLKNVDAATFKCTSHPFREMRSTNFRNDIVEKHGFVCENLRVVIPILRVWNVTAMAADLHPFTLGGRTKEARHVARADCTHFCPNYGGMFEVWATLLQNNLAVAQPLQDNLRPRLLFNPMTLDLRDTLSFS
jgi:hypothetical protein